MTTSLLQFAEAAQFQENVLHQVSLCSGSHGGKGVLSSAAMAVTFTVDVQSAVGITQQVQFHVTFSRLANNISVMLFFACLFL
jgi:hypothetical protein